MKTVSLIVALSAAFALGQTQPSQPKPSHLDPNLLTNSPLARQHLSRGRQMYLARRQKCSWKPDPNCESAQLAEVVDEANAALQLDPDYAAAHNLLGAALTDQRKFNEALAELRVALQF